MNKTKFFAIAILAFAGCTDNKKAETQKVFDEVMQVHEKVMSADEQLTNNRMQLDTLITQDNPAIKDSALLLKKQLADADDAMNNWMHKFEPDFKGRNSDETLMYITAQKKQIVAIDSAIKRSVAASTRYLQKIKKK